MELRQLKYFKVVSEAGSFARGSQTLRIAQPALSRSIAKLEDEIGHKLFIRHSAGISMTDAGQRFYDYALEVLGAHRQLIDGMADHDDELKGEITLGAPQSIQAKLVLPVVAEFLNEFPRVKLDIVQNSGSHLRDQVAEGMIDMAIVPRGPESGVHFTPLIRESICLVCHKDDRPQFPDRINIEDLLHKPLILSGYPDSLRLVIDNNFQGLGIDALNVRCEVNCSFALVQLVMMKVGFGVVPSCAIAQVAEAQLAAIPIEGLDVSWAVASNWNRRGLRALLEIETLIMERARGLVERGDWPNAILAVSD